MKTYLFYDTETTGLNPCFDQVLTFACIRTDTELNELDRTTITIRLRKDIIPSPGAFLTHGLSFDELESGITEYQAAEKIYELVNTPSTVSIGYNSLEFDDEFLRFMFYRNLMDPYTHQYRNNCSRMDILPVALVFRIFSPDVLNWPSVEGKPSLKLELIAAENNFTTSGRAHEAMSDVEALIALSRKLRTRERIWNYILGFFDRQGDETRIRSIETGLDIGGQSFKLCIMASPSFGHENNYLAPVIYLGESLVYSNQSLWLRLDGEDILGMDTNSDVSNTFVMRKRFGDARIVLPAFERFWRRLSEHSRNTAEVNIERIASHTTRLFEYINYHRTYEYPVIPDLDCDAGLYQDGFFTRDEKKQIKMFHDAPDHLKADVLKAMTCPRVKSLASRIIARNFESYSDMDIQNMWRQYLARLASDLPEDRIAGYRGDIKFNRSMGLEALKSMDSDIIRHDPERRKIFEWLEAYIGGGGPVNPAG
jgi:exodeoxyribonuclease-1